MSIQWRAGQPRAFPEVTGLAKPFKAPKKDPDRALALADEIIKNTYRTLMTRGMKGCYVYATDPGLRAYLCERLQRAREYEDLQIEPVKR